LTGKRRRFDVVCFDFDSTLTRLEGIDELARRAGVEDAIAPLTTAAMDGSIPLDAVYGKRLEIVRPDREAIAWLAVRYRDAMMPGCRETIAALKEAGAGVHIVSGGIRGAILPFAADVGVPDNAVHAVEISFKADGSFAGYDRTSPLATPGGKAAVCRKLATNGRSVALVGDGVTDLAARDAGAFVVGFGGVAERDAVRERADAFVQGPNISDTLAILLIA
jgi:phosphoserine phosphatase